MSRVSTIVRWVAFMPVAVVSGVLVAGIAAFTYRLLPGEIGEIWRDNKMLPASAAAGSAIMCFAASTTALVVGVFVAPAKRRVVLISLAVLLSEGGHRGHTFDLRAAPEALGMEDVPTARRA